MARVSVLSPLRESPARADAERAKMSALEPPTRVKGEATFWTNVFALLASPMTVEIPAATAAEPRVTEEAPVRARTSTEETEENAESWSEGAPSTASVSLPAPPEMMSPANWAAVETVKASAEAPPTRVREAVLAASWVTFRAPEPTTTLRSEAAWEAAPRERAPPAPRERTSRPVVLANSVSPIVEAFPMARVSEPAPRETVWAAKVLPTRLATLTVAPLSPEIRVVRPAPGTRTPFVPRATNLSAPPPPTSVAFAPVAVSVSPLRTEVERALAECAVRETSLPLSVAS